MPRRAFDCAICQLTLFAAGPQLHELSFGQLFEPGPKTLEQQRLLADQFTRYENTCRKYDQTYGKVIYDCNKILGLRCGHVFHSGCLREWYFTNRHTFDLAKCPTCNQLQNLNLCVRLYIGGGDLESSSSNESLDSVQLEAPRFEPQVHNQDYRSKIPLCFLFVVFLGLAIFIFNSPMNEEKEEEKEEDLGSLGWSLLWSVVELVYYGVLVLGHCVRIWTYCVRIWTYIMALFN